MSGDNTTNHRPQQPRGQYVAWAAHAGRHLAMSVVVTLVSLYLATPMLVFAQSSSSDAISQPYQTTATSISTGTLVSLVSSGSRNVQPTTIPSENRLVGIAVTKPVLTLSAVNATNAASSSVQVAVSGTTEALVSDANGDVTAGDKVTVSPLTGIGMKAIRSGEIVGTAQASLTSVRAIAERVKGTDGKDLTIHVGLIPVAVNVAYYAPFSSQGTASAYIPPALQSLANSITGKAVSPLRVLIAAVTLLLGFAAVITMLAVATRSGIISLGRNPLAQNALRRGMADVLIAAVGILLATGVIIGVVVLT